MATHKSLKVTFWTRVRDLLKGIVLYGTVDWRRASDELQPPKLSPIERKMAMPSKDPEVIKPRHNPQAALIKTLPKKLASARLNDVTAGAIVSEPLLDTDGIFPSNKRPPFPAPELAEAESVQDDGAFQAEDQPVVRRRRRHCHGSVSRHAPRTGFQFSDSEKPGLLARIFGAK